MVIQLTMFAGMWSRKINQSASPRNKSMRRSRSAASAGRESRFEAITRFGRLLIRPTPLRRTYDTLIANHVPATGSFGLEATVLARFADAGALALVPEPPRAIESEAHRPGWPVHPQWGRGRVPCGRWESEAVLSFGCPGSARLVAVWSVVLDACEPTFRVRVTKPGPTPRFDLSHRVAVLVVLGSAVARGKNRRGRAEHQRNRDDDTKFAGH